MKTTADVSRKPSLQLKPAAPEINRAVVAGLEPAALGLGLFYAYFALSHGIFEEGVFRFTVVFSSGAAAVLFLLLGVSVRRLNIPPALAHSAMCTLYGLALLSLLLLHRVLGESLGTSLFLVLLCGIGGLVLSWPWFAILLGMVSLAWGAIAWLTPPAVSWTHLAVAAALAVTLGLAVMRSRLASLQYAERRRLREQKKLEVSLATAENRLRLVADNANDIIFYWRLLPEPGLEYVNPAITTLLGYTPEEVYADPKFIWNTVHPDDRALLAGSWMSPNLATKSVSLRWLAKGGRIVWLEQLTSPVFNAAGAVTAVEGIARDVTDRKVTELAVIETNNRLASEITVRKQAEERFRRVIESAPSGIILTDRQGRITLVNVQTGKLFGYSQGTLIGQPIEVLVPERFRARHPGHHAGFLVNPATRSMGTGRDLFGLHSDGREFPVEIALNPIEADDGPQILVSVIDITERMVHEEMLRVAKDRAEEASRVKSVIFANMSHEIRTPMTAILGYSDLLTQRLRGTPMQRDAETIYQGGVRLLHLLNGIIDLARIEAGRTEMHATYHPIRETVERVTGLLKVLADQKGLRIDQWVDGELMVYTDIHAEEQVLTNLLGNAIRFTEQGVITLTAVRKPFGPSKIPMAVITLQDTGIGISEQFLPHVFDEFRQESEGFGRQHEGSGLGLSITRKLVEKMTGQIHIASSKGAGTTVIVALPLAAKAAERNAVERAPAKMDAAPVVVRNILVVEDDPACGQLLERMLSDTDKVTWCESAEQGIECAAAEKFDVVLMDINLKHGGLNGVQGLHEIRKLKGYERVAVLAVTAFAMKGDRERFIAEGFDDYIAKPFEPVTLRGVIERFPCNP